MFTSPSINQDKPPILSIDNDLLIVGSVLNLQVLANKTYVRCILSCTHNCVVVVTIARVELAQ